MFAILQKAKVVAHSSIKNGDRFTRWVVIDAAGDPRGANTYVQCLCECGVERKVRVTHLLRGHSRSCGCLQAMIAAEIGRQRRKEGNTSAVNSKILAYKRGAKFRDLVWELSREEFLYLTNEPCFYCKSKPQNVSKNRGGFADGNFIYNGIDRKDSKVGYVLSNCVPCCKRCNIAKSDMSIEEFLEWVDKVAERTSTIREIL